MRLVLNPRGRYLYEVAPHSLFMGGIQLDVQAFLEDESDTTGTARQPGGFRNSKKPTPRKHA